MALELYMLDMGRTMYGDSILAVRNGRSILIDAGHPGDSELIQSQLSEILGEERFNVDLLIVTHCHSDHIGCMPNLVATGVLRARFALVADEGLGFGRDRQGSGPLDDQELTAGDRKLLAALLEEPRVYLDDAELAAFIEDAGNQEDTYRKMLNRLEARGTRVIRYGQADDAVIRDLENEFSDFGLRVLGPTKDHLVVCADFIVESILKARRDWMPGGQADSPSALAEAYRAALAAAGAEAGIADSDEPAEDRMGAGSARNDQSIVLKLAADGLVALLPGDMQFTDAQVPDLDDYMTELRETVRRAGPYNFIKLSHHTSYNGFDKYLLEEWRPNLNYAHTGGTNDAGHPDKNVLKMMERVAGAMSFGERLTFARTDRHGQIRVHHTSSGVKMVPSRGRLNDFTPNKKPPRRTDVGHKPPEELTTKPAENTTTTQTVTTTPRPGAQPPPGDGMVEVTARIPHVATRVTITINIEPAGVDSTAPAPASDASPSWKLGSGRTLPPLLFVTSSQRLQEKIGRQAADAALGAIRKAGQRLADLPPTDSAAAAAAAVRKHLAAHRECEGVVLVGGYDVVPADRLDVLDSELRQRVGDQLVRRDGDGFVVWSDEIYGDRDGDRIAELPVSRVPDGGDARVVIAALSAPGFTVGRCEGIRNLNRPFAAEVFAAAPGSGKTLHISEKASPGSYPKGSLGSAAYYMLHGSDRDTSRFWGEDAGGDTVDAFDVTDVPANCPGAVVFTGCCWGALTATPRAARHKDGAPPRQLTPDNSIALAYLRGGALAYVGCTGTHYSPAEPDQLAYGRPMHSAFWDGIANGQAPAAALYDAKREYAKGYPHGLVGAFNLAVEMKILRQYTCLGLGW